MPDDKKPEPQPSMSEENYKALLAKISTLEAKVDSQDKLIKDVTTLNKSLLNTTVMPQQTNTAEQRHEELHKKLMEGLHHA